MVSCAAALGLVGCDILDPEPRVGGIDALYRASAPCSGDHQLDCTWYLRLEEDGELEVIEQFPSRFSVIGSYRSSGFFLIVEFHLGGGEGGGQTSPFPENTRFLRLSDGRLYEPATESVWVWQVPCSVCELG